MGGDSGGIRRKEEHVRGALKFLKESGRNFFDDYRAVHNALPEIDLKDVDSSCAFLGRRISAPLMIASLTGGPGAARKINENLAAAAQGAGVPLALGSAKVALKDPEALKSFKVRRLCPDVPLCANLGLADLERAFGIDDCAALVKVLEADALIFHVNPLHEALQAGGNTNFAGLLKRLKKAVKKLGAPVIVKEVGHGIGPDVFRKLDECGVYAVDVAGAGGACWGYIEGRRAEDPVMRDVCGTFRGWGIPTPRILKELKDAPRNAKLIGSGGVRSGADAFKAVCLGADMAAAALPFLKPALEDARAVEDTLKRFIHEFRLAMFSTGCRETAELGFHLLTED